jgi:hypothetical protein
MGDRKRSMMALEQMVEDLDGPVQAGPVTDGLDWIYNGQLQGPRGTERFLADRADKGVGIEEGSQQEREHDDGYGPAGRRQSAPVGLRRGRDLDGAFDGLVDQSG